MKNVKIFVTSLFFLILGISILLQVKLELYISKQNECYNILLNKKRLKYTPAVWYYLKKRDKICRRSFLLPYIEKKLFEFSSHGIYDEYMVYCYFTKDEMLKYIENSTSARCKVLK